MATDDEVRAVLERLGMRPDFIDQVLNDAESGFDSETIINSRWIWSACAALADAERERDSLRAEVEALRERADRLKRALREIASVLGPTVPVRYVTDQGAAYEWQRALDVARRALGEEE